MKHLLFCITILFSVSLQAQIVNIPDINFKNALINHNGDLIDTNNDGEIQVSEAEAFTGTVNVEGIITKNFELIEDLTGIEAFINITGFNCALNQIISLDLSNNIFLTTLICEGNLISNINISNNTLLEILICDSNNLTTIDISNNTALTFFSCNSNQLININFVENTLLTHLYCSSNELSELDISTLPELKKINCGFNQLTSLDLSNNIELIDLWCNKNQLSTLDLSNNLALKKMDCGYNQFTSLDLSNNLELIYLMCKNNQLSTLDLSNNLALKNLDCEDNHLTSLVLTNNTALNDLRCNNNELINIDLSNNPELVRLKCNNNNLVELDFRNDNNSFVYTFNAWNNPELTCIYVDDANYSSENWTGIDPASTFVETQAECDELSTDDISDINYLIHPNPVVDLLTIRLPVNCQEETEILMMNITGKIVFSEQINKCDVFKIDISELHGGMYFIKIINTKYNIYVTKKIIKI